MKFVLSFSTDSSMYAHFLFEAFDTNKNGSVSFEVSNVLLMLNLRKVCQSMKNVSKHLQLSSCSFQDFVIGLSIILRGTIIDRLNWAFNLYDLNKDGCITKEVKLTLVFYKDGTLMVNKKSSF